MLSCVRPSFRRVPQLNINAIIIIIIIITNEKIKVMLSRKRCRGTLQDYKKGEISKCQSLIECNDLGYAFRNEITRQNAHRLICMRN